MLDLPVRIDIELSPYPFIIIILLFFATIIFYRQIRKRNKK